MKNLERARRLACGSAALSVLIAACGADRLRDPPPGGFANFDLLLTDAPAEDLLAFQATLSEMHLVIASGGETANLLAGPVDVEFLGLRDRFVWFASRNIAQHSYSGVRLVYAPGSYEARLHDGSTVAVNALANEATFNFSSPIMLPQLGYSTVNVDFHLADSLSGSVASPPITFSPVGSIRKEDNDRRIEELVGVVMSADVSVHELVLNAFVDGDGAVALGDVLVKTTGSTLLFDDDGDTVVSSQDFFAALVANTTRVAVHGELVHGALQAERIEIEENQAGGGFANLVKIDGRVTGVGPGMELELRIAEVAKGAAIVAAASGGTIPASLDIAWDDATEFLIDDDDELTTSAALLVGQRVRVKLASFTNPPFTASRIAIVDMTPENRGTITSIAGMPSSIVAHLDSTSPAVLSGEVQSSTTDVTVDLTGSVGYVIETENPVAIAREWLLAGMRVVVRGSMAGTPAAPTVDPTRLTVRPGELDDAEVATIDEAMGRFTTTGGTIGDPFGTGVGGGPQSVLLASSCVFAGEATTRARFFDLFENLGGSETLVVRVEGLGTGNANEIRAFEIRAEVED